MEGEAPIRWTARAALALYAAALAVLLARRRRPAGPHGPQRARPPEYAGDCVDRAARALWSLGLLVYLAHVAAAFHLAFGWSHAAAVEHTRRAGGVGEGIWASHLFGVLWALDAAWWWLAPASHAARPAWLTGALHGYLAFIAFNATVVFETGPTRWAGVAVSVVLAALLARRAWPGRGAPSSAR
jgi:hypothetical protein